MSNVPHSGDPLFIFYDQEPIYGEFNFRLFDYIRDNLAGPFVLVTTEKESDPLSRVQARYGWPTVYYFHHAFAAHDWFRGYEYNSQLIEPRSRTLKKKYVSFNRLTSYARVYRSLFVAELVKHGILDQGHVSYNDICPENNETFVRNLADARDNGLITQDLFLEATGNIAQAPLPLRVDYKDQLTIPNHSFILSAVPETQESFCYVVTETCFWEKKHHLTEKIFKPIVSRMPFILIGPANNLAYLKEYGFETFSEWWDESYDTIEDPVTRLKAATQVLNDICKKDLRELEAMLKDMGDILNYNYNRFYSHEFVNRAWKELTENLRFAVPI